MAGRRGIGGGALPGATGRAAVGGLLLALTSACGGGAGAGVAKVAVVARADAGDVGPGGLDGSLPPADAEPGDAPETLETLDGTDAYVPPADATPAQDDGLGPDVDGAGQDSADDAIPDLAADETAGDASQDGALQDAATDAAEDGADSSQGTDVAVDLAPPPADDVAEDLGPGLQDVAQDLGPPPDPCAGLDCDDGKACTTDACDPATGCTHTPAAGSCDDGNACTVGDVCAAGACQPGPNLCTCLTDADCAGKVSNLCLGQVKCDLSQPLHSCVLVPGTAVVCPTGANSACAKNQCQPATGLCAMVPGPDGGACDDGSACTAGDKCLAGKCKPGSAVACSDGNPCSDDSCSPASGCKHTLNQAPCDDANPCTAGDACKGGKCAGSPKVCDDGKPCTSDGCDAKTGACSHVAGLEGQPCDAGKGACSSGDVCKAGVCSGGVAKACKDDDVCTDDACDPVKGCVFLPNGQPCDADGDPCTVGDACSGGSCKPGQAKGCGDGNPCTADQCNPATGLCESQASAMNGKPCGNGPGVCPSPLLCKSGKCLDTGAKPCEDGNPCTTDACTPAGCQHTALTGSCSDNDACTSGDACQGGKCVPGVAKNCDDGKPCTLDSCKSGTCLHSGSALDGKACDAGGGICDGAAVCKGGKCKAPGLVCDDGNPCTDDGCKAPGGCFSTANTAPCSDGNGCTVSDSCSGGACKAGGPKTCDDQSACTTDACEPKTGACTWKALPGCGKRFFRTFGGKGGDSGHDVAQTPDGGYVAVGYTETHGAGDRDFLVVRTDACGNPLWARAIGGKDEDQADTVTVTKDGGFLVAGGSKTWPGTYVVRLDGSGNVLWAHSYGGGGYDHARHVRQTDNGDFLMVCDTYSFGANAPEKHSMLVYRLAPDGKVVWSQVYGGPVEGDAGFSLVEVKDAQGKADGLMIAGATESYGTTPDDFWLLRLNDDGTLRWSASYGGGSDDEGRGLAQTPDGGFVVTGYTRNTGGQFEDVILMKLSGQGDIQWIRRYGGGGHDEGKRVFVLPDGYVVLGYSASFNGNSAPNSQFDAFLLKTDLEGKLVWFKVYGNASTQYGFGGLRTADGGYAIGGQAFGYGPKSELMIVKVDADGDAGCATTNVPLGAVTQKSMSYKREKFKPLHFDGGFLLEKGHKATVIEGDGFGVQVCPCQ